MDMELPKPRRELAVGLKGLLHKWAVVHHDEQGVQTHPVHHGEQGVSSMQTRTQT